MRTISVNIQRSWFHLSPFDEAPVEFGDGQNFFKAESQASGGNEYANNRTFRPVSYIQDAIPTSNGYEAVKLTPYMLPAFGRPLHLANHTECCLGGLLPVAYDPVMYLPPVISHGKTLMVSRGGECQVRESPFSPPVSIQLKGLDITKVMQYQECDVVCSAGLVGLIRADSMLVAYTAEQIYLSSINDLTDFTPTLYNGAQSFALAHPIGFIVKILYHNAGMYVFGSEGCVYGSCKGDVKFPVEFRPVANINGIRNPECVSSHHDAEYVTVMTKAGLMRLNGVTAVHFPVPSLSKFLMKPNTVSVLGGETVPTGFTVIGGEVHAFSDELHHTRDRETPCDVELLVEAECATCCNSVAVHSISATTTLLSYAKNSEGEFTRAVYIDEALGRMAVLHFNHTDVAPPSAPDQILTFATSEGTKVLVFGGSARMYLSRYSSPNHRAIALSAVTLQGTFDTDNVSDTVLVGLGHDEPQTTVEPLGITSATNRRLKYEALIRATNFSTYLKFSGRLNAVEFTLA